MRINWRQSPISLWLVIHLINVWQLLKPLHMHSSLWSSRWSCTVILKRPTYRGGKWKPNRLSQCFLTFFHIMTKGKNDICMAHWGKQKASEGFIHSLSNLVFQSAEGLNSLVSLHICWLFAAQAWLMHTAEEGSSGPRDVATVTVQEATKSTIHLASCPGDT